MKNCSTNKTEPRDLLDEGNQGLPLEEIADHQTQKYILSSVISAQQNGLPQCPAFHEALFRAAEIAFLAHPRPLFVPYDLVEPANEEFRRTIGTGPGIVLACDNSLVRFMGTLYSIFWLHGAMREREQLCLRCHFAYRESDLQKARLTWRQKNMILRNLRRQVYELSAGVDDEGGQIVQNTIGSNGK